MLHNIQVNKKYESVLDENKKLKKDESNLLDSLKIWEQKYKELEEKNILEDVEEKTKERIASQQSKCRELKVTLDKVIKTLNKDTDVSV